MKILILIAATVVLIFALKVFVDTPTLSTSQAKSATVAAAGNEAGHSGRAATRINDALVKGEVANMNPFKFSKAAPPVQVSGSESMSEAIVAAAQITRPSLTISFENPPGMDPVLFNHHKPWKEVVFDEEQEKDDFNAGTYIPKKVEAPRKKIIGRPGDLDDELQIMESHMESQAEDQFANL